MLCFPPFCFPLRFFLYLLHPLPVTREEGCHVVEKKVWDLAAESRQTQIAAHQHSSEDDHRLIAVVWAAALQLSQDRHWYLFPHANKTAVAYPTGTRWRSACCVNTSVLSASSPLSLRRSSHCFFLLNVPSYHLNSCEPPKLSKHLAGARGLSGSSEVWQQTGQRTSGRESGTAGWGQYRRALSGMCPQLDKLAVCSPLYVYMHHIGNGNDRPHSLMLFCLLWLMHILLIAFICTKMF